MLKCQVHKRKRYYNKKKSVDKYSFVVMSFVFYDSENNDRFVNQAQHVFNSGEQKPLFLFITTFFRYSLTAAARLSH